MKKTISLALAAALCVSSVFAEKFTVAVISDTQNYCDYRYQTTSTPSYPYNHGDIFVRQMQYIANNSVKNGGDIAFAIHVGDVVQNGAEYDSEWQIADKALSILDDNLPWGIVPGNHDYDKSWKDKSGRTLIEGGKSYEKYFGQKSKHFAGKKWYGGSSNYGMNSWSTFTAGGKTFMFLGLQTEPDDDDIKWAQRVLDDHKNIPVILDIHEYLGCRYEPSEPGVPERLDDMYRSKNPGSAQQLWDKLIKKNKQIFLVVCGHDFRWHEGEDPREGEIHRTDVNDSGYKVYQLLSDYQGRAETDKSMNLLAGKNNQCGDGWMRLMEFDLDNNQIHVRTYSTELNKYETDMDSDFVIKFDWKWNERFGK